MAHEVLHKLNALKKKHGASYGLGSKKKRRRRKKGESHGRRVKAARTGAARHSRWPHGDHAGHVRAGKKAARTRARNKAKRSRAAKKAARTRKGKHHCKGGHCKHKAHRRASSYFR